MTTTNKILVNQAAICAALGVSGTHVNRLEKEGVIVKERHNVYDLVRSVKRYIKRLKGLEGATEGSDYYAERARLTKAQADERELKIKIQEKELIQISVAEKVWCDAAIIIKNNLLAVPNKVCHSVLSMESTSEISDEIKSEIIRALESTSVDKDDYKDFEI